MLLIFNSSSFGILLIHLVFFELSKQALSNFLQVGGVSFPPNLVDPLVSLNFLFKRLQPLFIQFFKLIVVFLSEFLFHGSKLLFLPFSAFHRTYLLNSGFLLHQ